MTLEAMKLVEARYHKAIRDQAWDTVLKTPEGVVVFAEILYRLYHGRRAENTEQMMLQQVAWEILQDANLLTQFSPGSLPVEYVHTLTRTKLERDQWLQAQPEKPSLLGRILGRKSN